MKANLGSLCLFWFFFFGFNLNPQHITTLSVLPKKPIKLHKTEQVKKKTSFISFSLQQITHHSFLSYFSLKQETHCNKQDNKAKKQY
jgi:hypothetical protein